MLKKVLFLFLVFFSLKKGVYAQFSANDSLFLNTIFTEIPYQDDSLYPGTWYDYPAFNSIPDFFNQVDSIFKFGINDWNGAYNHIQLQNFSYDTILNPTFNTYYSNWGNAYQQYDPLVTQSFVLNGKSQTAFSTYTPSSNPSNCKTAYLIIPGSDNNQTTELILGYGYHNNNCTVKNTLSQYGDVYIHCKPLEDYRAIRWNGFKLNSGDYVTPGPSSYIYNYLNVQHKPYGVNYLIECLALLKMMKGKYDKVIVAGCSLGGYSALLAGLESPVDGVICSSGYSIYFDSLSSVQFELSQNFDSLIYQYPANLVKNKINQANNKKFLFSYADLDNYLYQLEHDSSYTQNFLNSVSNCSFFTNFQTHSFPPCNVLEDFSDTIVNHSAVRFLKESETSSSCNTKVKICPGSTFNFYLVQNGTVINSYLGVQDSVPLVLTSPGVFTLTGITSGSNSLFCTDTIHFNPMAPTSTQSLVNQTYQVFIPTINHQSIPLRANYNGSMQVSVYSTTGDLLAKQIMRSGESISCRQWSAGLYFIQIQVGQERYTFKTVINNDF